MAQLGPHICGPYRKPPFIDFSSPIWVILNYNVYDSFGITTPTLQKSRKYFVKLGGGGTILYSLIARFHMTENKISGQANYAVDASTYVDWNMLVHALCKKSNVYIDFRIKTIFII